MPSIEQRLRTLEKRAQIENERFEATKAHLKALSTILDCIGAPICAANPPILPVIIKNLKECEKEMRKLNQHEILLWQLRRARGFFEKRKAKAEKAAPGSANDSESRRKR